MTEINSGSKAHPGRDLRLWPGIVLLAIQLVLRFILPAAVPSATAPGIMGGVLFALLTIAWWVFFSRAPKGERWLSLILIILSLAGTSFLLDNSIATANMGLMFVIYSVPVLSWVLVLWAVLTRHTEGRIRRISLILTIVIASGFWILLRTDGMTGVAHHRLNWRWAPTHEQLMLSGSEKETVSTPADTSLLVPVAEWPGFRGSNRDGIVSNLKIKTDWQASPPEELWRRKVGPGCSSAAICGGLLYTQEQLGDSETVSCYSLDDGKPVWKHKDKARFYDSHAGAGPRSTPYLSEGKVFTMGGTGILNALDARTGKLIWSRNAAGDTGVEAPTWGISGSPLVSGNLVIVSVTGRLAAYDKETGEPAWQGLGGRSGYSSPQPATLCNIPQVLLMNEQGLSGVDPGTGKTLWQYEWKLSDRVLQPAVIGADELLVSEEYKNLRRLKVTFSDGTWKTEEKWTSPEIKNVFNDYVIDKSFAYGFDGPSMSCIDLENGKRTWRGARYQGFQLMLADQGLILVLSEKGDLALVSADPVKFRELGKIHVLPGKTWNHPAIAGNILLVRNSDEMAAYRLAVEE
jgi:outer membrane protein assembly factor BamB